MKIYTHTFIIGFLCYNVISNEATIKCNGTILFDHYNVSETDQKEKKLDIYSGDEVMVMCQLDEVSLKNGCLSSNLTYEFGIGDVPPQNTNIELVNNKTLQLKMITNRPAGFTITCLYNGKGLNSLVMSVNVGHEPQPIKMMCLMYPRLGNVQCEFEISGNPVLEKYTILYTDHSTEPAIYNPAVVKLKDKNRKWSLDIPTHGSTDPFGMFTFLVNGTNRFGVLTQKFTYKTEEIVVVPDTKAVKITNIQCKSVTVEVIVPEAVKMYEFIYNVTACTLRCDVAKNWLQVNITNITSHATKTDLIRSLNISLPHADQLYKLKINVQLKDALYPNRQQTTVGSKKFRTLECVPEHPPTTFSNGFEIRDDNEVIVYWKEILDKARNGPEFKYDVAEIHENGLLLSTVSYTILSNSSARLTNLDRNKNYTIRLMSRNLIGESIDHSNAIHVPRSTDRVAPPDHLRKTRYDDTYELSWKAAPSQPDVISYTLVWCRPLDEMQTMCGSLLDFKTLPKHQTTFQYNTTRHGMESFAIVANTRNSSSGLVWFTCSMQHTIAVTHHTDSSITLNWTMPCHINRKSHMLVSYCESDPYRNASCGANTKTNMLLVSVSRESIVLTNLKRCTSYLIKIQDFYPNTTHPMVINAITSEGDPPTPVGLQAGTVTNTSIEISWSLPYKCPTPLRYSISYNNLSSACYLIDGSKSCTIKNLSSFSLYNITVAGCYETRKCSTVSEPITIKTRYGVPAGIEKLISNVTDNGFTFYTWQPSLRNAEFQYYEVKQNFTQNGVDTELTSIVSNPKCTLVKNPCDGTTNHKYFVRMINIDRDTIDSSYDLEMNATFKPAVCFEQISYTITTLCANVTCLIGEWNIYRDLTSTCFPGSIVMKISVILVMSLAFGAGICAGIMIGIRKYRAIKNVGHVSMPDGLDSIFKSRLNLKPTSDPPSRDEDDDIYCTYEYIFSSANRLDIISVSDSITTLENQDDYLDYGCNVVPLPNPGNYVKLNDLQNQSKIPTSSGYTSISALQTQATKLPHSAATTTTNGEIQLAGQQQYKIPNHNGYLPISAISTITTPAPVKMSGYVPVQMLQTTKPSNGYTPVSALQHNSTKSPTLSRTNGYVTIAALQSQTS